MRKWTLAVLMAVLPAMAACDRDEADTDPGVDAMEQARVGWSGQLRARIDSGNVAYREGRYDEAAELFRRAAEHDPQIAAPWFGLHMAESARGNQVAADSALMRADALTPGLGAGHPQEMPMGDTPHGEMLPPAGELPPGHPPRPDP